MKILFLKEMLYFLYV